jgi:uncharacterized protein YjbI with pentapeptide repeats
MRNLLDSENRDQVIFIQGGSGQGKTAFCKMLSSEIYKHKYLDFIPVFIQLQDLKTVKDTLAETFRPCLQAHSFFSKNLNWLADEKNKFLIVLDGFDELTISPEEIQYLVDQITKLQENLHHQFLITGRSLTSRETENFFGGYDNIIVGQLQLMSPRIQDQWIEKWSSVISNQDTGQKFRMFLHGDPDDLSQPGCPEDIKLELAGEPLSLYLLANLFKTGDISPNDFRGSDESQGRVKIYQKVLERALKRVEESRNYKHLSRKYEISESIDLEELLMNVALCTVHSNGESVRISEIKQRIRGGSSSSKTWIDEFLKDSRKKSDVDKLIQSLLLNFYIRLDKQNNEDSLKFIHRSFCEFLFAKKIKKTLLEKFHSRNCKDNAADEDIYRLMECEDLTIEVARYFSILLFQENVLASSFDDFKELFLWFYQLYWDWSENKVVFSLNASMVYGREDFGFRDVYAKINIMILLLELYRYAQLRIYPRDKLPFHLCQKEDTSVSRDDEKLIRIIGYSYSLNRQSQGCNADKNFVNLVGSYLNEINLSGIKLPGVNLTNADLRKTILEKADLSRSILFGADLRDADLSGADLSGVDLREAKLSGANLNDVTLAGANLSDLNFAEINYSTDFDNLKGVNLNSANLSGSYLKGIKIPDGNLSNLMLDYCDLSDSDLQGTDLSNSSLRNADLKNADLRDSILKNTSFRSAKLDGASFVRKSKSIEDDFIDDDGKDGVEHNIDYSNEDDNCFENTDFSKASLLKSDFEDLDLAGVNFERANLQKAIFKDAILSESSFFGADLSDANLEGAYLGGADFRNAVLTGTRLSRSSLKDIQYNELTIWEDAIGLETAGDVPPDWH